MRSDRAGRTKAANCIGRFHCSATPGSAIPGFLVAVKIYSPQVTHRPDLPPETRQLAEQIGLVVLESALADVYLAMVVERKTGATPFTSAAWGLSGARLRDQLLAISSLGDQDHALATRYDTLYVPRN